MISRRMLFAIAAAAVIATASATLSPAGAAGSARFDSRSFDAAVAAGKPVLVEISAPWCPVCKVQKKHLAELFANPKYAGITALDVDFDSQGDVVRSLGAQRQSTLIVFSGGKEVARSVGDTSRDSIAALLDKAL